MPSLFFSVDVLMTGAEPNEFLLIFTVIDLTSGHWAIKNLPYSGHKYTRFGKASRPSCFISIHRETKMNI
jgi:hypothetical protein